MNESVERFGSFGTLVGVSTHPDTPPPSERPAVLFLNAGLLHHVGPNRLHVHLARLLAERGFTSLRFDLSGIGDSAVREDLLPRDRSVVSETREAMDHMQRVHGSERFVLFGICAGAEQAQRTGLEDERVAGTVLVDGLRYRTFGFTWRHYVRRAIRPRSWSNLLHGRHPAFARRFGPNAERARPAAMDAPQLLSPFPPREEGERLLLELLGRTGPMLLVYTRGSLFNHAGQARTMFPRLVSDPRVSVAYQPVADHLFMLLESQETVASDLTAWLERHWPAPASPTDRREERYSPSV